ncbi:MAG: acyl-CoA dehydrogenase [Hyphomicrobiaceae bacterium]
MTYQSPVDDIMTVLKDVVDLDGLIENGDWDGLDEDTVRAIIEEAGRFGAQVLDPLNWPGDRAGSTLTDGVVQTPKGWKSAYRQFTEAGWNGLPGSQAYGGQGLPAVVAMAVCEIWNSANLSFGLCPLLTQGAIDAIEADGSNQLKDTYLAKMVSGEWTGTMNLTEPQAGSDLRGIKTKAVANGDGTYRITGTKIFITYGDHELTDNIIHLVLARLPDAPEGTRGISLFLVPKYLVNEDGSLGARNDVKCIGLEEKLGIHASPTCVMSYGEGDGAVGYLIGEENRGLNTMFIMMNHARLAVGVQGVSLAERATQRARAYASERRQGHADGVGKGAMAPILAHADIRRTILTMRSMTQAARSICLVTARELDKAQRLPDKEGRKAAEQMAALLTPIAKAFSTDIACEVSSMGVQVHGGMGFIEETGAAQYYRDARILPIYEGTNGIQAIDLVTRKLPLEGGDVVKTYLGELQHIVEDLGASNQAEFSGMSERLTDALNALTEATQWMGNKLSGEPQAALAGATPYLRLFGLTVGGCYLVKTALSEARNSNNGGDGILLARFFVENLATAAPGLAQSVMTGADAILDVAPDHLHV